ncbi:PREDICTED: rac GTPase-activating protein 1-like [Priapulus caudatus]|uniref:Rac GTPase-activating protein 1-like n=1 Tax=Priapulus caudatus TaxID=37621 RepID=A0ABM1DYQ2_PRICU|nr:PREDICTED: rac GTPase-activating protein 1-like [Priapulus caudatus]XP_014665073.1 PREDICTED: rac GTPase-activating protein 1-like [Priapulus caudatus]
MNMSKLSLVARYDDLVRNTSVLTQGIEGDIIQFVKHQELCRSRWLSCETEVEKIKSMLRRQEAENSSLELKLKHARQQIESEMNKRMRVESDKDTLDRQMGLIGQIMNDNKNKSMLTAQDRERLSFLNSVNYTAERTTPKGNLGTIDETGSLLSVSDCDMTEESADGETLLRSGRRVSLWRNSPASRKKRSVPSAPTMDDLNDTPPKKRKSDDGDAVSVHHNSIVATTTVTVPETGPIRAVSEIKAGAAANRMNRSFSEPGPLAKLAEPETLDEADSDDSFWGSGRTRAATTGMHAFRRSPGMQRWNSAGKGLNKQHAFVTKTIIKPETCTPCGKRIKFGKVALKCKDCKATCHQDCKDQVPLPCVSIVGTPTSVTTVGFVADFAPPYPPYIPALIVHCVKEVERRGLNEVGIYRVPGSEREVRELKDTFLRGRGMPNLSRIVDIHVVCGTIKLFLRTLKEPLVTHKLWSAFVQAAERESIHHLYNVIDSLPEANRDTMAYVVLHLQKVASCRETKMSTDNLSKVFGPTLVGYSGPDVNLNMMSDETCKQFAVVQALMELPGNYWDQFVHGCDAEAPAETNAGGAKTPHTPEARSVTHLNSMLGPVETPRMTPSKSTGTLSQRAKSVFGRTPNTGKYSVKHGKTPKQQYFASPVLK